MSRHRFALPPAALARLALMMLALGAAHGVYAFARLFVSPTFAAILAAAFELTYIGLATLQTADEADRVRARRISVGAVGVSISYNAIAAFLGRNPDALGGLSGAGYWLTEAALAALFGAPLALVAFLLADLLLHRAATDATSETSGATSEALREELATLRATSEREARGLRSLVEELRSEVALLPATGPATEATSGVQCEDCGASFASSRALGGHRSRCTNCQRADPFLKGLCRRCYHYQASAGAPRPPHLFNQPAPEAAICRHCKALPVRYTGRGLCMTCYAFERRNGRSRPLKLIHPRECCRTCSAPRSAYHKCFVRGECPTCYSYRKRRGVERPRELIEKIAPRGWCDCGLPAAVERTLRTATVERGKIVEHVARLCVACARMEDAV